MLFISLEWSQRLYVLMILMFLFDVFHLKRPEVKSLPSIWLLILIQLLLLHCGYCLHVFSILHFRWLVSLNLKCLASSIIWFHSCTCQEKQNPSCLSGSLPLQADQAASPRVPTLWSAPGTWRLLSPLGPCMALPHCCGNVLSGWGWCSRWRRDRCCLGLRSWTLSIHLHLDFLFERPFWGPIYVTPFTSFKWRVQGLNV